MSPITFKFFAPRGACRRFTYEDTPEFRMIDELVDGMVEGRRFLTYRDSEGDVVQLETSKDVAEAVKDAHESGVKSIKVQVRLVQERTRNNESKATTASNNSNRNQCGGSGRRANCYRRAGAAPQWGRYWSRGIFGQPHHISVDLEGVTEELDEIFKHLAPFFGIHFSNSADGGDQAKATEPAVGKGKQPSNNKSEYSQESQETTKEVEDPKAESMATTPKYEAASTPIPEPFIEETVVPQTAEVAASGFTFVENEQEDSETKEAAAPEPEQTATDYSADKDKPKPHHDVIDEKLKLLKDMGFELSRDVARNMITELNGRMDLIVRALVANQK